MTVENQITPPSIQERCFVSGTVNYVSRTRNLSNPLYKFMPYIARSYLLQDLTASCTQETAVKYLLGWHWAINPYRSPDITDEEWDLRDYSLHTLLREHLDFAESDYQDAIQEELDSQFIEAKLKELKQCEEDIIRASYFLRQLSDELAKGIESKLRIDPFTTVDPNNPYITIVSLHDWANAKYQINIFDITENSISYENHQDNTSNSNEGPKTKSYHSSIEIQLIFKALLEVFVENSNQLRHPDSGKLNVNQISKTLLDCNRHNEKLSGCSERNLKDYITRLGNQNESDLKEFSNSETKTLQKIIALLIDACIKKHTKFQISENKPDIEKLAAHLAKRIQILDSTLIKDHLTLALDVRLNPDKPR